MKDKNLSVSKKNLFHIFTLTLMMLLNSLLLPILQAQEVKVNSSTEIIESTDVSKDNKEDKVDIVDEDNKDHVIIDMSGVVPPDKKKNKKKKSAGAKFLKGLSTFFAVSKKSTLQEIEEKNADCVIIEMGEIHATTEPSEKTENEKQNKKQNEKVNETKKAQAALLDFVKLAGDYGIHALSDLSDAESFPMLINYIMYVTKIFRAHLGTFVQDPIAGASVMGTRILYDILVRVAMSSSGHAILKKMLNKEGQKYIPVILYGLSKGVQFYFDPKGQTVGIGFFLLMRLITNHFSDRFRPLKNFLNWGAYFAGSETGFKILDKALIHHIQVAQVKSFKENFDGGNPQTACNGQQEVCQKTLFQTTFPGAHNSAHNSDGNGNAAAF